MSLSPKNDLYLWSKNGKIEIRTPDSNLPITTTYNLKRGSLNGIKLFIKDEDTTTILAFG